MAAKTLDLPALDHLAAMPDIFRALLTGVTDGQARWNLISRNGQDVVSGIYLFTVVSNKGNQRGKFVVIR